MITRSRAFATAISKVVNNVAKRQFEVSISGSNDRAYLSYEQQGNHITLITTEGPPAFQGQGVGKILAESAFDYALNKKLSVTVQCNFIANFYEKNLNKYKSLSVIVQAE